MKNAATPIGQRRKQQQTENGAPVTKKVILDGGTLEW